MKLIKPLLLSLTLLFAVTMTIAFGLPVAAIFWGAANLAGAILAIGDIMKAEQLSKSKAP